MKQLPVFFCSLVFVIIIPMKKVRIIIAALAILMGGSLFAQNVITSDNISITINGTTTREQLWQLRQDMQVQGIDFQYTPRFDNERKLISIQYTVKRADGTLLGTAGNDQLANPAQKSKIVLTKENEKFVSTCVGNCPN
jgi:hypothetical protein